MTWLIVIGIVILLLLLFLMLRVGSVVEYGEEGFRVQVRVGLIRFTVYPAPERKEKEKAKAEEKKKAKQKTGEEPEAHRGGDLALFKELIRPFLKAAAKTRRKLRIDLLRIDFTSAAENPAAAAIAFGGASAALGAIVAVLENTFRIKERQIRTRVDYTITEPELYLWASISLRIWQGLTISLPFGIHVLRVYRKHRRARRQRQKMKQTALEQ